MGIYMAQKTVADNIHELAEAVLSTANQVVDTEIQGLQELKGWLGDVFVEAVQLLAQLKGRVVVSGMGKSGHIARKIAATLASTGTPALFIHPAEASHGDLGMISDQDIVILLSNSGETSELRDIISFCKRFSIPLIGIVRRKTSVLAQASKVALVLPDVEEACTVAAPTTSTTMMLALGDMLAVSLLELRGFNEEDFNTFHPGGKLGAAFMKVNDLMHSGEQLPVVRENTPMPEVIEEMSRKGFGCTAVCDDANCLLGVITDGDLRRHIDKTIANHTAAQIMTANPVSIQRDHLASEGLAIMQKKAITSLFVTTEERKLNGLLHIHDLLKAGVL